MKELHLIQTRKIFTDKSTISERELNGQRICYILEDRDRGLNQNMPLVEAKKIKVKAETCIPYGTYELDITLSSRFKVWLPIFLNVPNYIGIREHTGTVAAHTEGCQLPGTSKGIDCVKDSTGAFYKLMLLYLNHLTLNTELSMNLIDLHKKAREFYKLCKNEKGKELADEFGNMFTKNRVKDQKIFITIKK